MKTARRKVIRRAAKEWECFLCGGIIQKREEHIVQQELTNLGSWGQRTEELGHRHIDCRNKGLIDQFLTFASERNIDLGLSEPEDAEMICLFTVQVDALIEEFIDYHPCGGDSKGADDDHQS